MTAPAFEILAGGKVVPGIPVKGGVIVVGEEGRGRKLVRVPAPPGAPPDGRIAEAPGEGVLVLIRDQKGFRGDWFARAARSPADWQRVIQLRATHVAAYTAARAAFLVRTGDEYSEVLPDGSTGYFTGSPEDKANPHPGPVGAKCPGCLAAGWPDKPGDPPWTVIAEGVCAQGIAGGMGRGPEYLVRVPFGAAFEIARRGRLYGAPAYLRVAVFASGDVTITSPEADAEAAIAATAAWGSP